MQAGLRRETGVARLRLRRNNLAGYFVEVPSKAAGTLVGRRCHAMGDVL